MKLEKSVSQFHETEIVSQKKMKKYIYIFFWYTKNKLRFQITTGNPK